MSTKLMTKPYDAACRQRYVEKKTALQNDFNSTKCDLLLDAALTSKDSKDMDLIKHFKLHHWPGLTFFLFMFTFIISYLMAVLSGHVYGFFPYISDTGTKTPESCVFGQLMNLAALCLGITLYIRYRQIGILIDKQEIPVETHWNTRALWAAIPFSLGTSLVANIQESAIFWAHMVSANITFLSGIIYFSIQTVITNKSVSYQNRIDGLNKLLYVRVALNIIFTILYFVVGISGMISLNKFNGKDITLWTSEYEGYYEHLVSTFSEWIFVISMLIYLYTFTNEFKRISFVNINFLQKGEDNNKIYEEND